jgi:hypothetical protein
MLNKQQVNKYVKKHLIMNHEVLFYDLRMLRIN